MTKEKEEKKRQVLDRMWLQIETKARIHFNVVSK
jgi:hypothetical protein